MSSSLSLFWFRQDLRISDNPGFLEAARIGKVLPIFIMDNPNPPPFETGSASKVYLHYALLKLNQSLKGRLNFYIGPPQKIILQLIDTYQSKNIFWNRCYEPWQMQQDEQLEQQLQLLKIHYQIFNGSYLWDPKKIKKENDSYYRVFGAFKKKVCLLPPRKPLSKPKKLSLIKDKNNTIKIDDLQLITGSAWQKKIISKWEIGENAAQQKLKSFIKYNLTDYKKSRNYPGFNQTSRLSPNLHFGEISPHQVWQSVLAEKSKKSAEDIEQFLSEILWREFSCYLITHFKKLPFANFQAKFNVFPWRRNKTLLRAWQTGNTGYPLIDAGMRELWQTGYMHNRVRMIVASFLVKNLMIHWHHGRDWFWDCLIDADLANNSANWQWVAGCGVDAAPYFRIFNPVIQGEKFDHDGLYTKKFVPELKNLPNKYLFKPWRASEKILKAAGVILGKNYPKPIVDLKSSRAQALMALKCLT